MQISNNTQYSSKACILSDLKGRDTLHCLVQATYVVQSNEQWRLLKEQPPIMEEDQYWGSPDNSSLKTLGTVHAEKSATDIIISGLACAKEEAQVSQLRVSINVGVIEKKLNVYGNRYWHKGKPTPPEPFTRMPIVYENAFGGKHFQNGTLISSELRNPVGRGYAGKRGPKEMEGQPLPNIEDPTQLIKCIADQPEPAGFGPIAPYWQQRSQYAGTYDKKWQRKRAPYFPEDYNARFQNCAHPDLIYPGFLQGGEQVKIENMHPIGSLEFTLPEILLAGEVKIKESQNKNGAYPLNFVIDTLHLKPNSMTFNILWRAVFSAHNIASLVQQINISEANINEIRKVAQKIPQVPTNIHY